MPKREHSSTDSQSKSSPSTSNKTDKGHDDTVTIKRLKLENKELNEQFNNLKNVLNTTKEKLKTTMEQLKKKEEEDEDEDAWTSDMEDTGSEEEVQYFTITLPLLILYFFLSF